MQSISNGASFELKRILASAGSAPKPSTGEQEMIALHATAAKLAGAEGIIVKPTTGEWTAVNGDLNTGTTEIFPLGRHRAKTIADAHNAALAAERERLEKQWGREGIHITMERLTQELDAEREKLAGKEEFWSACEVGYEAEIKQLRSDEHLAYAHSRSTEAACGCAGILRWNGR